MTARMGLGGAALVACLALVAGCGNTQRAEHVSEVFDAHGVRLIELTALERVVDVRSRPHGAFAAEVFKIVHGDVRLGDVRLFALARRPAGPLILVVFPNRDTEAYAFDDLDASAAVPPGSLVVRKGLVVVTYDPRRLGNGDTARVHDALGDL